ncbi:MAG: zinc ABC transporter substrate-binding protein [Verrucomicrobia bacterium]|nr:zinc ABC transporter substrate-binding protein [Verrucomicrobiota bacterium]
MQKYWFICSVLLLVLALGCKNPPTRAQDWMQENGKVKVLCTTAMVADIVQGVGGEQIDCLTLIQGENDPHSYQLVKGDDEKFSRADLIFCSGLGLEHGPSLRAALEHNPKVFSLGDYLHRTYPSSIVFIDKTVDPHVWMDVGLWQKTIEMVSRILSEKMPDQKALLEQNARSTASRLSQLDAEIAAKLQTVPLDQRYLVTTHDAFNYFTRAYLAPKEELSSSLWRLRCQAPEGLAPDSQLSTADIQQLTDHLIRFNISTIFAESNVSQDSLKKIVDVMHKKGRTVHIAKRPLYADACGTNSYQDMMQYDAEIIARGLLNGS